MRYLLWLAILAFTGCATAPSLVFEPGCSKRLFCEKQEGDRCTQVRIETQSTCRALASNFDSILEGE